MDNYKLETPVRMAVIKLDDYAVTGSTGGVVEYITYKRFTGEGRTSPYTNSYEDDKTGIIKEGYLAIQSKNAEPGWIYTDKTNILLDSNKK